MPRSPSPLLSIVTGAVLGGILGVGASFAYDRFVMGPRLDALDQHLAQELSALHTSSTTPTSTPEQPIQIQPKFVEANEGVALAERTSMVGLLRKKGTGTETATDIGQVVSVTADGWLVTAATSLTNLRLADVYVVFNGKTYDMKKGLRDTSTGLVFLKIDARDLPVAGFAPVSEVSRGQLAFVEPWQQWELQTISSVQMMSDANPVLSEVANRRFLVSGLDGKSRVGMAVWDRAGRLIGVAERHVQDGWLVIPAAPLSQLLSSVINDGVIKRASLGVRSQELAMIEPELGKTLPETRGAWLRPNHTLPAIVATGPSAKTLLDGDAIERIDRDILDGTADLGEHLLEYRPGSTVTVTGLRKGVAFEAQVQLASVTTSEALK